VSCYRHEGTWYARNRHADGCPGDCDGCEVCDLHCTCRAACKQHLDDSHPLTAPACIGRVRDDLRAIVDLTAMLPPEAEHKGIDSEAANLAGPATDAEAWSHRKASAMAGRADHVSTLEEDDEAHPLRVLGTWDFMLREDYAQPTALRATVSRSADYLDGQLDRLAQDDGQDFPLFAREVRACRLRIEAVLHDGEQRDTGAPCMTCGVPLVREWGRLVAADGWRCPRCREFSTEDQYRFAVAHLHREEATHLTDRDMEIRTGVRAGTVREWARRGHVAKRLDSGRVLYAVADVEERAGTRRSDRASDSAGEV
jgi:hypothetical protein